MQLCVEIGQSRNRQCFVVRVALRQITAQGVATFAQILHLFAVFGETDIGQVAALDLLVGYLDAEAVAELLQRSLVHFFRLVGDVLRFAGLTHAVTFNGFGQNHGRAAVCIVHRFIISRIYFVRVVAAAVQCPDFVIGHIGHQGFQLGRVEEMFTDICTVFGFISLVVAVQTFVHAVFQCVVGVACQQCVPAAAPNHFQYIPAGTAEVAFQFLDNFAVAANRAVQTLQVTVDDENQVIQTFACRQCDCALAFRLVHFTVAAEYPNLAAFSFTQTA